MRVQVFGLMGSDGSTQHVHSFDWPVVPRVGDEIEMPHGDTYEVERIVWAPWYVIMGEPMYDKVSVCVYVK